MIQPKLLFQVRLLIVGLDNFYESWMFCETHKPAYPSISNDKSTTSAENAEHKKGVSLFKRLPVLKNKFFIGKQNNCLVIV